VKSGLPNAMKDFDGNKEINGRKNHIVTDTTGCLLTVLVHNTNLQDSIIAMLLFKQAFEGVLNPSYSIGFTSY